MPKLPQVGAAEAIKVFEKVGFVHKRTRGIHYIMRHPSRKEKLVIPLHGRRSLGKGLLNSLIDDSGLNKENFLQLLKKKKIAR